jgi:branched-chain amino acid transport system substrate-binding protein
VDGAVAVFAAVDGATVEARRPSRRMSVAPAALALVVAAAFLISRHAAGLPPGTWTIAVGTLPASAGGTLDQNTSDAARLALDTINAGGGIGGRTIGFDAVDAGDDEEAAGPAARAIVSDSSVVAMIGPAFSGHAAHMIPVTNEAGLLECSPSATLPQLTKPSKGSLSLRAAHPDRINFVRLAPAEDIQAPGMAAFAYRDLAAPVVLLVDDGDLGLVVADPFEAAFRDLGGSVVRRTLRPGTDPKPAVDELRGRDPPRVVFYAGRNRRDAAALRTAMVGAGQGDVPLLSWDAIVDGSGATPGSFLQLAGRAAANTYAAHASVPPMKASFATEFRTRFGREPDEYAAAAYACVEIIADGLREAADRGVGASELRDAVRRSVADDTRSHDTVVGSVRFDGNGDTRQQFVTFYRVDASAANGAGDWIVWKQQDFGPAPE